MIKYVPWGRYILDSPLKGSVPNTYFLIFDLVPLLYPLQNQQVFFQSFYT